MDKSYRFLITGIVTLFVAFSVFAQPITMVFQKRSVFSHIEEKPIVIVITSYNNSKWYKKNLDSVFSQKYSNFRIVYVDDCSPDGTGVLVEQYICEQGWSDWVTLVKNEHRVLKMANFVNAVHDFCDDDEIIFDLDGDDWFAHNNVLSIVNKEYANPEVWMTYGTYVMWPKPKGCLCGDLPQKVIETNGYRDYGWVTSQQRTFYAWLFKKIRIEDFMLNNKFVPMAADLAYMFPMLEMAGGRVKYIKDILYIYNRRTPINDDNVNVRCQQAVEKAIRAKSRYSRLASRYE